MEVPKCKAPHCNNARVIQSNHCKNCSDKFNSFYKEYKLYQKTNIDPFLVKDLETLKMDQLEKHYEELSIIYELRKQYQNAAFGKNEQDESHEYFISFLQDRAKKCNELLTQRFIDSDGNNITFNMPLSKLKFTKKEFIPKRISDEKHPTKPDEKHQTKPDEKHQTKPDEKHQTKPDEKHSKKTRKGQPNKSEIKQPIKVSPKQSTKPEIEKNINTIYVSSSLNNSVGNEKRTLDIIMNEIQNIIDIINDKYIEKHISENELIKDVLILMDEYLSMDGKKYPWNESYLFCRPAFEKYLNREGISDDFRPYLIDFLFHGLGYYSDNFPWKSILKAMYKADFPENFRREIYIEYVSPGFTDILIELSKLEFIDSRLIYGITIIQRKFRRWKNRKYTGMPLDNGHNVKVKSIKDIPEDDMKYFSYNDVAGKCFFKWNRHLTKEIIRDYLKNGDYMSGKPFIDDIYDILNEINILKEVGKENILSKLSYPLTPDNMLKIYRIYTFSNELKYSRSKEIDILKFIQFDKAYTKDQLMLQMYQCPLGLFKTIVLNIMPKCLSSYGRKLVCELQKININNLNDKDIRYWSSLIIPDDEYTLSKYILDKYHVEYDIEQLSLYLNPIHGESKGKLSDKQIEMSKIFKKVLINLQSNMISTGYLYNISYDTSAKIINNSIYK
jgi:hypothetical protein